MVVKEGEMTVNIEETNEEELKSRAKAVGLPEDATQEEIEAKEREAQNDTVTLKKDELDKMKKQINYASGSYRIIEKLEREIEDLKRAKPPAESAGRNEEDDISGINKLLEEDLVAGIDKIVERKLKIAEGKRKETEQLYEMEQERNKQVKLLHINQNKVLEKHPELADVTSEKSRIWMKILEEHPEYKTNYLGPISAMRDMEDVLSKGKKDDTDIEREIVRRKRVEQTTISPGNRSTVKSNEVVLSKEQKELCDLHNWDYKTYARTLKRFSGEKKVEAE